MACEMGVNIMNISMYACMYVCTSMHAHHRIQKISLLGMVEQMSWKRLRYMLEWLYDRQACPTCP